MSSPLMYRGKPIYDSGFAWCWELDYDRRISVRYRRPFPLCWRFRSDEEALRMLCDKVDANIDREKRSAAMVKDRQEELSAREALMKELDYE